MGMVMRKLHSKCGIVRRRRKARRNFRRKINTTSKSTITQNVIGGPPSSLPRRFTVAKIGRNQEESQSEKKWKL